MGYSKETERQNKALGDLLKVQTPEKRVMVGQKGKEKEKGDIIPKMTELMKDVRMPWFCPSCKKTMKKNLDRKFWTMAGHCMDCHVEMENKLRITGDYETYAKIKNTSLSSEEEKLARLNKFFVKSIL